MSDLCDRSASTAHAALPGLVPAACHLTVPVVVQEQLARDTYRLRLAAPDLARQVVPGQFFMIRSPGTTNPLLGRPFALYDTYLDAHGNPAGIDVVYLVVGKMTGLLSRCHPGPGTEVEIWGPLGNGFPVPGPGRLLLVAGGIGNTPFLAVAREALALRAYGNPPRRPATRPSQVDFCYGVRSAEYLAGLSDFTALGLSVKIATDNGTSGHHGFVTDLVEAALHSENRPTAIYCCGPEPMMHAVARQAEKANVDCWLSLETPMACGFGACFSCVTRVRLDDGGWDYRRTCVEGPIFPAKQLVL